MRKTLFVYRRSWFGSAQIRAFQIGQALGSDTLGVRDLTPDIAGSYDAIVYVKTFPPNKLLEQIRARGVKQIFDPIDEFRWWKIWLCKSFVDAFIASNLSHAFYLEKRFGAPAVVLPHHHCNYDELRIPPGRTPPTLGYIANDKRWRLNRRIAQRLSLPIVTSFSQREGRKGLPEIFMSVDIGFEFRNEPTDLRFKPATKVVNFMSFGIPSVLPPEIGYLEVARHGEQCLYAHTPAEMALLLDGLARDPALRARIGEAGYEAARPYHITNIAARYRDFLSSI
jgi:hypothetical protein